MRGENFVMVSIFPPFFVYLKIVVCGRDLFCSPGFVTSSSIHLCLTQGGEITFIINLGGSMLNTATIFILKIKKQ